MDHIDVNHLQRISQRLIHENLLSIIIAIVAVLIVYVITAWISARRIARNVILLTGPSGSGKTSLFLRLKFGNTDFETCTSMKSNKFTGVIGEKSRTLTFVDYPGHPKLLESLFDELEKASKIVFIIDASTLARNLKTASDYLYDILSCTKVQKAKTPILIVCNKTDLLTAIKEEKAKQLFERELNILRNTRTAGHEFVTAEDGMDSRSSMYLGYEGEEFKFEHLDNQVDFTSSSVVKDNINGILEWIS